MKLLITFLMLLVSASSFAQLPYDISTAEYDCFILRKSNNKVYNVTGTGLPVLVSNQPSVVTQISGALHHYGLIDDAGEVYMWGTNTSGEIGNGSTGSNVNAMYHVTVDSAGNTFGDVKQLVAAINGDGYYTAALKNDGTVWVWGRLSGGHRGNNMTGVTTKLRPVKVDIPGNIAITKIQAGDIIIALDENGDVWTWGGGSEYNTQFMLAQNTGSPAGNRPVKINLPSAAADICGASYWNYALLADGKLYGWGPHTSYLGIGNRGYSMETSPSLVPRLLDTAMNFPATVTQLAISAFGSYALLTDGTIWAWGSGSMGGIGNGRHTDYSTYSPVYADTWALGQNMQQKPAQVAPGKSDFAAIYSGPAYAFYAWAQDSSGNLFSWGRNKYGVLGNGVMAATGDIAATYPNSWDVPWITPIAPFSLASASTTSSPRCVTNPSGSPCSGYSIPSNAAPAVSAGSDQSITVSTATLSGTVTPAGSAKINYYLWTQISGPNTATIPIRTTASVPISNLQIGTYVFQLKATDNTWRSDSATVSITVADPSNSDPVANAGEDQIITLPTNSVTVDGSASYDPDGTIVGYSWEYVSGPGTYTITSSSYVSTTITGLIEGVYVFKLTVVDDDEGTAEDNITITVNPAPIQPPVQKYITIPKGRKLKFKKTSDE